MTTTTSKVVRTNDEANEILRQSCEKAAANGGTFSVNDVYEAGTCWFTVYVISWPDGIKVEELK
jgi:hypothetical protein